MKNEDGKTVGLVPIELSKVFNAFLADYGAIEAERIGNRYNSGGRRGLEIPVDYKLTGNAHYLKRVLRKLKKKEPTQDINFSDVMKC